MNKKTLTKIAFVVLFSLVLAGAWTVYQRIHAAQLKRSLEAAAAVIHFPGKLEATTYQEEGCSSVAALAPGSPVCSQSYLVVYQGSGDFCTDYNTLNAAFLTAGYKLDQGTQEAISVESSLDYKAYLSSHSLTDSTCTRLKYVVDKTIRYNFGTSAEGLGLSASCDIGTPENPFTIDGDRIPPISMPSLQNRAMLYGCVLTQSAASLF